MAKESTQHKLDRVRPPARSNHLRRGNQRRDGQDGIAVRGGSACRPVGQPEGKAGSPQAAEGGQHRPRQFQRRAGTRLRRAWRSRCDNKISGDGKLSAELNFKHMRRLRAGEGGRASRPAQGIAGNAPAAHSVDEQDGRQRQARGIARPSAEQYRSRAQAGPADGHRSPRPRAKLRRNSPISALPISVKRWKRDSNNFTLNQVFVV